MKMAGFDKQTKSVQKQFNRQANDYAQTAQARDVRAMSGLVQLSRADGTSRSLDVACGPGRLTASFAQVVEHATGIDATENLLAIARTEAKELGVDNVTFIHGSAMDMPFADASFDVVSCRAAFHHFAEPAAILAEMVRVTAPSGRLLIADILGHDDATFGKNHDAIEQLCDASHVHCLSGGEFSEIFERAGLKVVKEHFGTMDYELDSWLAHGGPDELSEEKIRELMSSNQVDDETGLQIRSEGGAVKFTHQTVVYLLESLS